MFALERSVHDFLATLPVETFKRHVWINPFWEDDLVSLVETMGADRVVFGSDWPHMEGLARPLDYVDEVKRCPRPTRRASG